MKLTHGETSGTGDRIYSISRSLDYKELTTQGVNDYIILGMGIEGSFLGISRFNGRDLGKRWMHSYLVLYFNCVGFIIGLGLLRVGLCQITLPVRNDSYNILMNNGSCECSSCKYGSISSYPIILPILNLHIRHVGEPLRAAGIFRL